MTEATKKPAAKKAAASKAAAAPKKAAAAAKPAKSGKTLKVTQVRSPAGRFDNQLATLKGLGLNRIRRSKVLEDTPSVRGMIEAVKHLVIVEDAA
jgi:large subunit ribosomal protein L30